MAKCKFDGIFNNITITKKNTANHRETTLAKTRFKYGTAVTFRSVNAKHPQTTHLHTRFKLPAS